MGDTIEITLPDATRVRVPSGTPARDILRQWRGEAANGFLAAVLDDAPIDLARPIDRSGCLRPLTFTDPAGREILQHSAAHLVAKAVTEVIPAALPTDGPPTEDGFHYDFDVRPITPEDLTPIASAMARSIDAGDPFVREELSKSAAERLFEANRHKLGYLAKVPESEVVSVYRTGAFVDLCLGPHVPDTRWLRGTRILGVSGLQGSGGSPPTSLQRVRGVSFPSKGELEEYLQQRKESEARDHRLLGPRLEMFLFADEAPGFPFWLPKGMVVLQELERFVREHLARAGYGEVRTPLMFAQSVYETSGHWELFRQHMFVSAADERPYGVKPMNCPGSMMIFRSRARSYRELPMRLAEFAPLHRLEASGTIHGLTRAREFIQDDAHLFVTDEQIESEVRVLLEWIREAFTVFRLDWSYELSTRPTAYLGDVETWNRAEAILQKILTESGIPYTVSPGEGAFYGPKIDIHLRDSMGRRWQTGTIQLDYQMPRRFGLEFQGTDGALHTPVVIHRVILGSLERFVGILLEHTAGRLPPWLAPVQVRVLPLTDRHQESGSDLVQALLREGIRAELVPSVDSLSKRVRGSEIDRVPYVAVIGDKELESSTVSVRVHGVKEPRNMGREAFLEDLREKIRARTFDP